MPGVRLHKSSIVVGCLLAAITVLTMVPGRVVDYQPACWKTFEHGWPLVYLRRQIDEPTLSTTVNGVTLVLALQPPLLNRRDFPSRLPMWGVPWLNAENWCLWQSRPEDEDGHVWGPNEHQRWRRRVSSLFIDIAACSFIIVALVAAWEFRRRRRPRVLCFTIADMLISTTLISAALCYLVHLNQSYQCELQLNKTAILSTGVVFQRETCIAPAAIRSLVGERFLPEFAWRTSAVLLDIGWPERDAHRLAETIAEYPYITEVAIASSGTVRFPFSTLRDLRLETIDLSDYLTIDKNDVDQLVQLKTLQKLIVSDWKISPHILDQLRTDLPDCRVITLSEDW
jgi:hypothetical protein